MASVLARAEGFNVRAFGAAGDGVVLDSPAINAAIAAAAAAGGGEVVFPAGTYLSYSVRLRSHVTLRFAPGAVLLAAEPPPDLSQGYDAPEPAPGIDAYQDFGHSHWHNSLIWGEGLEDVGIVGPGVINGRGLSQGKTMMRRDYLPEERGKGPMPELSFAQHPAYRAALAAQTTGPFGYPTDDVLPAGVGNKAIALKNCRNVRLRDFTVLHGGHFAVLATGVDNLTCDNLTIDTNRDGIDIDCCRTVKISNCVINSPYDDGICLKSSYALGAVIPTEDVTITNCQVSGFAEGTLVDGTRRREGLGERGPLGRIKLGTESNGGFRGITIANCTFVYSRGLALELVDGGVMEDIAISNLVMREITNAPIFIRLGRRQRGPAPVAAGAARRIKISGVIAHDVAADGGILIAGSPGNPIEDVTLNDIYMDFAGGGTVEQARREVPVDEKHFYPEPSGLGVRPSWALFARHVANLRVSQAEWRLSSADHRAGAVLEHVHSASFAHVAFSGPASEPHFRLVDCSEVTLPPGEKGVERR